MATSTEQIQAYLRSLGVDPGLFGNVNQNDLQYAKWGDTSGGMGDYAQYGFAPTTRDVYLAGIQNPTDTGQYRLSDGQFSTAGTNYGLMVNHDGSFTRRVKVGEKDSVEVPYTQQPDGTWAPNWEAAQQGAWDTNRGLKQDLRGMATVLGAAAGSYFLGPAGAGGEVGTGSGGAAASGLGGLEGTLGGSIPELGFGGNAAFPALGPSGGAVPGIGGFPGAASGAFGAAGAFPGMNPSGSWGFMDPALTAPGAFEAAMAGAPAAAAGSGPSLGTAGKVASAASGLLKGLGGGSGTGSGIGAGIGGLLGYLDAKSQPDSLTIKNEIDPRLAQYAYGANGTGGIAGAASNLMNQQLNGPNPLSDAGKQISGMANTLPNWSTLVDQGKSQWDANPWINEQQSAITNKVTQNLLQNVMPNIGSQANSVGGYGGSRQGIAQGLAMSNMNTDLAPALSQLASQGWENSQNRALNSAQSAGQYGLNNQLQQAGLLGKGAEYQQQGSWAPIQNATNVMGALPGNSSRTEPLFNNPYAGALGGASLGSQIGGGTNWGNLLSGIGNIGNWFNNSGSGSSGGVSSGMTGMGTINWNDLFGGASLPPYRG
jgi:hypothetical protein